MNPFVDVLERAEKLLVEAYGERERLRAERDELARCVADIRIKFPEVDAWMLSKFQEQVAEGLAIIEKDKP